MAEWDSDTHKLGVGCDHAVEGVGPVALVDPALSRPVDVVGKDEPADGDQRLGDTEVVGRGTVGKSVSEKSSPTQSTEAPVVAASP